MWSCQFSSSSQPIAAGEQSMWPARLSLLLLAFPPFTETPLLPLLSELLASLPASPGRDRERQACYKLVLSPQRLQLITSWGGQQRAGRTPSWIVFLRKEPDPAAHTRASTGGTVLCTGHTKVSTPPGQLRTEPRATHPFPLPSCKCFFLLRFVFSAKDSNSLGIIERYGEIIFLIKGKKYCSTTKCHVNSSFLTLHHHVNNKAHAFESSAQIQKGVTCKRHR